MTYIIINAFLTAVGLIGGTLVTTRTSNETSKAHNFPAKLSKGTDRYQLNGYNREIGKTVADASGLNTPVTSVEHIARLTQKYYDKCKLSKLFAKTFDTNIRILARKHSNENAGIASFNNSRVYNCDDLDLNP